MTNQNTHSRILAYLQKIPPAVSGQHGHDQTFKVAKILLFGFGLSLPDALFYLRDYSARCSPPWKDKELKHKLLSAKKFGPGKQKPL